MKSVASFVCLVVGRRFVWNIASPAQKMNERTHAQTNERTQERTNERLNQQRTNSNTSTERHQRRNAAMTTRQRHHRNTATTSQQERTRVRHTAHSQEARESAIDGAAVVADGRVAGQTEELAGTAQRTSHSCKIWAPSRLVTLAQHFFQNKRDYPSTFKNVRPYS